MGLVPVLVALGLWVGIAAGWRVTPQAPPSLSHAGVRWRIRHVDQLGLRGALWMIGTLGVLWLGWYTLAALLVALAGASAFASALGWTPLVATLAALVAVPVVARWSWTEITADPTRIRIARPWPRRPIELPWSEVSGIEADRGTLTVATRSGTIHLDAPLATEPDLARFVAWCAAGRAGRIEAEPVRAAPPPAALTTLLRQAPVSRASARAGPPTQPE
ncbi:MAG: hypothetical protein ABMB14_12860 [Myxococcota bacterium]